MTAFKKESHLRSILKGISWRIIATSDTLFVVLLVTCLLGKCSIEDAIKIGTLEFFIKFAVYYIHERIWQNILKNQNVTKKQTLTKSISWRVIATLMTFIISGTVLDNFGEAAIYIALVELFTKFVLYYFHERMWLLLPLGKIRKFFFKNN